MSNHWNLLFVLAGTVLAVLISLFFVPRNHNRTVVNTVIIMSAVCCYSLWAFIYAAQVAPVMYPQLKVHK